LVAQLPELPLGIPLRANNEGKLHPLVGRSLIGPSGVWPAIIPAVRVAIALVELDRQAHAPIHPLGDNFQPHGFDGQVLKGDIVQPNGEPVVTSPPIKGAAAVVVDAASLQTLMRLRIGGFCEVNRCGL